MTSIALINDGDKFICVVYSSAEVPLACEELSRLNGLFATYFAGMKVDWSLISAIDESLGCEIALKYLCIEKIIKVYR